HAAGTARAGNLTEAQCRKVLSELLERTTGETLRHLTVKEFLDGWLAGKELAKSEGTHLRYGGTVKLFLDSLGKPADKNLAAISPRDVERFRDGQLNDGKAPSSVNVDLKTLRTAFNHAWRQGLIPNNPVNAVELPKETRHQRSAFEPKQIAAILKVTTGEWRTAILFGYYLGARLSDAVTMAWENIDLPGKVVRYVQQKTGKEVTCPLHAQLEAHLISLPIRGRNPKVQLTPGLASKEVGGRNGLSREFKVLMGKGKVSDGRIEPERKEGEETKARAFSSYSF